MAVEREIVGVLREPEQGVEKTVSREPLIRGRERKPVQIQRLYLLRLLRIRKAFIVLDALLPRLILLCEILIYGGYRFSNETEYILLVLCALMLILVQARHEVADMKVGDVVHVVSAQTCTVKVWKHRVFLINVDGLYMVHTVSSFRKIWGITHFLYLTMRGKTQSFSRKVKVFLTEKGIHPTVCRNGGILT